MNERGWWDTENAHITDQGLAQGILRLADRKNFKTFWDLGCGRGKYVKFLNDNQKSGEGLDGNPRTWKYENCRVADLTTNLYLQKKDFTICLEVGEHIPWHYENFLFKNICSSSNFVILSWAVIGQQGIGHVNCKTNSDVIRAMELRNYKWLPGETYKLRMKADNSYFGRSLLIFSK